MIEGLTIGLLFVIIFETIHILIDLFIIKKIKHKDNLTKRFLVIFSYLLSGLLIFVVLSGFYIVKTNENILLTKFTGEKIIDKNIGIKYSFLSRSQVIDLRQQVITYPQQDIFQEDDTTSTKDGKLIRISAILEYRIDNPNVWAIQNKDTETNLFYFLSSVIKERIKSNNYTYIMQNRIKIEQEIVESLAEFEQTYGIIVINFYFIKTLDTFEVIQSKSLAEAEKIKSQALIKAYTSESEALKLKYSSIPDKDFIRYMELMKAIEEGNINTIIIPEKGDLQIVKEIE